MGWLDVITSEIAARRPVALATVLEGAKAGRHVAAGPGGVPLLDEAGLPEVVSALDALLASGNGGARSLTVAGVRVYVDAFLPPPDLVVVGAGHVAQPVAQLGKLLEFTVTVIDDRPDYANQRRFPGADRIICDGFVPALRALDVGPSTYVVLVTRGHRHDMECLRELIGRPCAYIGMIGSRIRVETVFRLLVDEQGVERRLLEKVYAPIGLDLNARTPSEIAVAVAAEVLKVRRGGTGESLSRLGKGLIHGR